jgi:hypothetical protein
MGKAAAPLVRFTGFPHRYRYRASLKSPARCVSAWMWEGALVGDRSGHSLKRLLQCGVGATSRFAGLVLSAVEKTEMK